MIEPSPTRAGGPAPAGLSIDARLRGAPAAVYAVLDAARDPAIPRLLKRSGHRAACLYEGEAATRLARYAPWLCHLPPGSPLVETLLSRGWGRSWGIYILTASPFDEVLAHLRQLILAQLPDGREVYFRFYDPRVLRTFIPTCTAEQLQELVAPGSQWLYEGASADQVETIPQSPAP